MAQGIAGELRAAAVATLLAAGLAAGLASPASATMEVHDSQNIIESAKAAAEAVKQTARLGEIKAFMGEARETLGPAVSLAMSVPRWVKESKSVLQCIVPNPGSWLPKGEGDLGSLCDAQDAVRAHLGLPTSAMLQGLIDDASAESRGVFGEGGGSSIWNAEAAAAPINPQQIETIRARRQVAYEDAVFSAVGTALTMQQSVGLVSGEVESIVSDSAAVDNINARIAQTNRALGSVLQELAATRAILAKLLELQAMERLERMPVAYKGIQMQAGAQ